MSNSTQFRIVDGQRCAVQKEAGIRREATRQIDRGSGIQKAAGVGTHQIDKRRGLQKEAGIRRVSSRQIDRGHVVQREAETRQGGTRQIEERSVSQWRKGS